METIEGINLHRTLDHFTVGIQSNGSEAHAYVMSFSLMDIQSWKEDGEVRLVRMEQARIVIRKWRWLKK